MEQNITEYIIEIYRKEDLMRAYHFDIEKFGNQVINFFPISPKEKLAQINHYEAFMNQMKDEGIESEGHISEINDLVNSLEQLHEELKESDKNYYAVYKKAATYIAENLIASEGKVKGEVQVCLNGIYGYLLLKIQERPIKEEEQQMINTFGDLLSLISFKYQERRDSN